MSEWSTLGKGSRKMTGALKSGGLWDWVAQPLQGQITVFGVDWGCPNRSQCWMWSYASCKSEDFALHCCLCPPQCSWQPQASRALWASCCGIPAWRSPGEQPGKAAEGSPAWSWEQLAFVFVRLYLCCQPCFVKQLLAQKNPLDVSEEQVLEELA